MSIQNPSKETMIVYRWPRTNSARAGSGIGLVHRVEQIAGGGVQQTERSAGGVALPHVAVVPETVIFDANQRVLDAPVATAKGQQLRRAGLARG